MDAHTSEPHNFSQCPPVKLVVSSPVTHFLCVAMTTPSELQATSVVIRCVSCVCGTKEKERAYYLVACNTDTNVLPKASIKPCRPFRCNKVNFVRNHNASLCPPVRLITVKAHRYLAMLEIIS